MQDIANINYDVKHASDKKIRLAFSGKPEAFIFSTSSNNFIKKEDSTDAFARLTKGKVDVVIYSWMVQINDSNYFIHNLNRTELVIITGLDDQ
ncbi:hypothetical protein PT285_06355 [Lactobacillus sp. ESL0791]|uniref:hypothetical protein n=1 Tax=Lactobacillus sp. ESL0791 TaxID=2983234 RepID=UPI0023F61D76|nr:hypothetical protein [Lactobacillus sp. ESL0791]MDF7639022.1 hypothetical protein [Lactobacillus sp. ESL0791]